jgi:hypothetical protein
MSGASKMCQGKLKTEITTRRLRPRYVAPLLHGILFASTWILYSIFPQPLLDGPAKWPFMVLWLADIPISVVCFGFLFAGEVIPALIAWGVLGTLWWYLIGLGIEKMISRRLRRGTTETVSR